ncbi:tyrosine-type recombinase/integrase [Paenibacillus peoriae]|uniref:tyrosine-type recombinase/integrase n=1 Tax=Paenibacillus peoriae TaxID=59893 RepID=UPI00215A3561|nr:site-specific integrase [Paenibacillus peoriae]
MAKAQAVYDEMKKGIDPKKNKKVTLESVAEEWLKTYSKGKVKRRTVTQRGVQMAPLKKYFVNKPIIKITHQDYQNFLNDLDDKDYAYNTISGIHNVANMIFKYALKNKYRTDNPTIDAIIPEKLITVEEIENKDQLIEEKYLNRAELTDFLSAAMQGEPYDKEIFYLFAFSGFRSGELCSLKWTDVDFQNNTIRITKTIDADSFEKYELTTPKTKKSIRVVPVDESIIEMLKQHQINQNVQIPQLKKLFPNYHDEEFVFCTNSGYPLNPQHIRVRMYRILKSTSIKKHATPHIFRHTYVSMLAEAGVDLNTIMQRVGHEDEKTTLKIYTHVTTKMQQTADQKIKTHFSDVLKLSVLQET